jgi:hypothetical protein
MNGRPLDTFNRVSAIKIIIAKTWSFGPGGGLIAPPMENSSDQDVPVVSVVDDVILNGE